MLKCFLKSEKETFRRIKSNFLLKCNFALFPRCGTIPVVKVVRFDLKPISFATPVFALHLQLCMRAWCDPRLCALTCIRAARRYTLVVYFLFFDCAAGATGDRLLRASSLVGQDFYESLPHGRESKVALRCSPPRRASLLHFPTSCASYAPHTYSPLRSAASRARAADFSILIIEAEGVKRVNFFELSRFLNFIAWSRTVLRFVVSIAFVNCRNFTLS